MKLEKAVQITDNDVFKVTVYDKDYNLCTKFNIVKDEVEDKTIYKYPGCTYEFFAESKVKGIHPFVNPKGKLVVQIFVMSDKVFSL